MAKLPSHLRSLPPRLAAALTPEQSRALSDLRTQREREARTQDALGWANGPEGMDALPEFLHPVEASAPRAADLWLTLPPGATLAEARDLGRRYGLDAEGTDRAISALRLAELATVSDGRVTTNAPASVPF